MQFHSFSFSGPKPGVILVSFLFSHPYPAWQQILLAQLITSHPLRYYHHPPHVLASCISPSLLQSTPTRFAKPCNPFSTQEPVWSFKIPSKIMSYICPKPDNDSPHHSKSFNGRESLTWSAPDTHPPLLLCTPSLSMLQPYSPQATSHLKVFVLALPSAWGTLSQDVHSPESFTVFTNAMSFIKMSLYIMTTFPLYTPDALCPVALNLK